MSSEIFVGRADELAAMTAELDRARAGQPRILWLSGPAGIGKTTLIRRLLAERPDVRVLWASGDEAETGLPFGVVGQLLADLPRPLRRRAPSPDADPLAVGAELLTVLGALESPGPAVLVLDDAQWMDDASARALVFVVRRLRRDQVLVVLGSRDGVPGGWARVTQEHLVTRLSITGLRAEEIVELAGTAGGPALSPAAGRRLRDHTDGHPLHVRSLLAELSPSELADTSRILPAPRSFAALVLVRVAKLGTSGQGLVLAAAVLGTRCALADAVALAAVPDPLGGLDEGVEAGLLTEGLSATGHDVAFAHELVRAAVYADLSPARRHALHRAAAARLGGDAGLQHRIAAAVGPDPQLAAELAARGHADLDSGRWHQAADRLVAAAELSDTPAERSAWLAAAVGAMITDGDLGRAVRHEAELRASGQVSVLGRLEAMTGRIAAARETLTAALATGDDAAAAAHLALVALVEGDAAAAAQRAGEALRNDPPPEVVGLARFVRVVGLVAAGRHAEARSEVAADPGDPEAEALNGLVTLWGDDPARAAAILSALVRDGASPTSVRARVLLLGHLAEAQYRIGDWDAAVANGALAVSLARDAGVLLGAGVANGLASYVASSRGEWDTATARVEAATSAAAALPWWGARLYAASAQAVLAQARGDHAAMEKALRAYTDPAARGGVDRFGLRPWRTLHVEALLGLRRMDEAEAALAALERRSPLWSAVDAARLRCVLTEIRSPNRARAAYADAMAATVHVPAELPRARLETAYGRHLLAAGDRRGAIDLLRTAYERLERLGAAPFLARCTELLHAAGLHPPAAGGALALTTQELAVARLVAEGRTNQEAGAALFVTSRTVAFHLSNIYAKLGVSTRRELAARLS